ncbi:MAG: hypothetical protein WCL27_07675 [Betaproteobacteria bacterium]
MLRIAVFIVFSFFLRGAIADVLIKPSEALLPAETNIPKASRAITRGPGVRIVSPDISAAQITSPFPLNITFEPRGGAKIDPATVKLTYLRSPNIELAERIKGNVSAKGINLASAEVPPGEHLIRVSVQDDDGRQTSILLNLNVK